MPFAKYKFLMFSQLWRYYFFNLVIKAHVRYMLATRG